MPTNDTSDVLVIGPDADGRYLTVAPGEKYIQPKPPRTVADDEADAARVVAEFPADPDLIVSPDRDKRGLAKAKAAAASTAPDPKPETPAQTPAPEGDPA